MRTTPARLEDLQPGDLFYAYLIINPADIAFPHSQSDTTTKALQGKPVRRICIVLEPGQYSVGVTYLATFSASTTLPYTLDRTMWYPFSPAAHEGYFHPLPAMSNGKAQWASLRRTQWITDSRVAKVVDMNVSTSTLNLIKQYMNA